MRRFVLVLSAAFVLMCEKTAFAQAFNLDFAGQLTGGPDSNYGAAANQTGFWNLAKSNSPNLRDIQGNVTPANMGFTGGSSQTISIPGATDGDKTLMESVFSVNSSNSFVVNKLQPGRYDLYFYCWGGSVLGPKTVNFLIDTGSGTFGHSQVSYGVAWPGGQVEGETYARIPVEILPDQGYVAVFMSFLGDSSIANGAQLVPVPAPGAVLPALALGVAGLAGRPRRTTVSATLLFSVQRTATIRACPLIHARWTCCA